eukprot:767845-Hanusia_phi.AAC.2
MPTSASSLSLVLSSPRLSCPAASHSPSCPPDTPSSILFLRYACAAFADGYPLVLGTVVADGGLEHLSLAEIASWLCLFLREGRSRGPQGKEGRNRGEEGREGSGRGGERKTRWQGGGG